MTECKGVSPKIKPGFIFDMSSPSNSGTLMARKRGRKRKSKSSTGGKKWKQRNWLY